MKSFLGMSLVAAMSIGVFSNLFGQESRPEGGRHGWSGHGESSGDGGGDRMARVEGFLRMLDTNGNGIIEPGEVPPERAQMVQLFASRMGVDPSQPIPIARIREALSARWSQRGGGTPPGAAAPAANGQPAMSPPSPNVNPAVKPEAPSLVPGFGTTQVPGFGNSAPTKSVAAASTASPTVTPTIGPFGDPRRAFREMRFRRYDKNGDGVLDKQEAAEMPGDSARTFDRNHDGKITLDEYLTVTLQPPPPPGSPEEASKPSQGPGEEKPEKDVRKSYRFLQPQERLPKGLPNWFTERDKNHDGQISMSEYASSWSDPAAEEFRQLDHNGDGILTPQECLKSGVSKSGEGHVPSGPAAPASGSPSPGSSSSPPASSGGDGSGKSTPWWMR